MVENCSTKQTPQSESKIPQFAWKFRVPIAMPRCANQIQATTSHLFFGPWTCFEQPADKMFAQYYLSFLEKVRVTF